MFISDLGSLPVSDNKTISDCISGVPDPHTFFKILASVVYVVLHTAPVSEITVSGNLFSRLDAVGPVFSRELLTICEKSWYIPPRITVTDHIPQAVRYLGNNIRTTWFSSYIAL